ncbi:hypothetical protein HC024_05585 [Methylococcaceae bacterium WWC4]|nr:hypothetical protein [Methylococcaceae bacterium WWC4]
MSKSTLPCLLLMLLLAGCASENCDNQELIGILSPNQSSAGLLMNYAKISACRADAVQLKAGGDEEKKLILIYDLYIKARSYKAWNSLFFGLSVTAAIAVFLWPALGVIFKSREQHWPWLQSPIMQTTVTGIAALMFAFYSQYKTKQTQTENLMRTATYSSMALEPLSRKIIADMSSIDEGFNFNNVFDHPDSKSNTAEKTEPAPPPVSPGG